MARPGITITETLDAAAKSWACGEVIKTLPDWFGQPESNARYVRDIADKDVFSAFINDELAGLLALKYHFGSTAEIWWLGFKPEYHRRGIGSSLVNLAAMRAIERSCNYLAVMTISEWSDDEFYRRTRLFYQRVGFQPFVEFNETDPFNPMMWMIRPL